jgi:hypothetical protein
MTSFLQLLENRELDFFAPNELDVFIQGAYTIIVVAVRDQCDTVVITRTQVVWSRNDVPVGSFPMYMNAQSIYDFIRRSFLTIIERDALVQSHFKLEYSDDDQLLFKITHDEP